MTGRHTEKAIHPDGFSVSGVFRLPVHPLPRRRSPRLRHSQVPHRMPTASSRPLCASNHLSGSPGGGSIVFTCRAADAMLDTGEARRLSRESVKLPRLFPAVACAFEGENNRVRRLNLKITRQLQHVPLIDVALGCVSLSVAPRADMGSESLGYLREQQTQSAGPQLKLSGQPPLVMSSASGPELHRFLCL